MLEFKYRPDIDGLRAVAVLLVLLFHADLGFPGGYVGVDVFFVISGFLITGLILKGQRAGTFSLAGFWERRIRRIVPAATCLVAATLIAGSLLLLPHDLEELAESAVAQQLMLANVYSLNNTGYFNGPAELKPLLHTWSLAVEEQFYLGFPLLFLVCRRLRKGAFVSLLCALGLVSFALSVWGSYHHPSAAFFLLPTRAWELLAGAILVFCPIPSRFKPWQLDLLGLVGLGGILFASVSYDYLTRFPGAAALLPCLGTALVIYSNSFGRSMTGRLLSTKVFVALGLISYSLYLWHWPILAYTRYWLGDSVPVFTRITALSASVVVAHLSWKYIESPFRHGASFKSGKRVVALAFACSACLLAASFSIEDTQGLPGRIPERARPYTAGGSLPRQYEANTVAARQGNLPQLGSRQDREQSIAFLVWGDSHAMAVSELFNTFAKEHGIRGAIAARSGIPPLVGIWRPDKGRDVMQWNQAVIEFVKSRRIANVILVAKWAVYVHGRANGKTDTLVVDEYSTGIGLGQSRDALKRGLERTIAALEMAGANAWLVKQVPLQATHPARSLFLAACLGRGLPRGVTVESHRTQQFEVDQIIDSLRSPNLRVLDPTCYCFDSSGRSKIGDAEGSFYVDEDHLSDRGAESLLRPMLSPACERIAVQMNEAQMRMASRNRDTFDGRIR